MDNRVKKILVVDDEKMNIATLAQFLKPQYEIIVAVDGPSALEVAETQSPDLILLDVVMPDMNGFEVLAKLKYSAVTINIPVIFITGLDSAKDEEKGLLLGAVDYIAKPFNKSVVKARINTHIKMAEYIHTIEKLCLLDALTGLPNRRGFDSRFDLELARAHRDKTPLGVILLDIDRFKLYNDTYGHPQGDVLLKSIANVLHETVSRSVDFTSRWGGEEFIVLLPSTDKEGTGKIAEQIRNNVKKTIVPYADGISTSVTVSIGGVSVIPDDGYSSAAFVSCVDKLLYKAKDNGRDQVCMG
ncbi:MAG: diguanylate cyclase [Treponema sp.]|jgi:diguanylate cyclase (GGDEF)-like protein|nr:diguanylate cyclase [Treponema sp.]